MDTSQHLQLLSATAQGDRKAFSALYEATSGKLYAVSLQLLQKRDLAEEALQEAYVRIWHNASEYNEQRGSVLAWMISIVRYRALDMLRAAKVRLDYQTHESREDSDTAISASPENNLFERRDRAKIDDCMDHLEKPQSDAITLAYFRGFTHQEVCHHMSTPLGSVKSWIRRGLERLKKCLET